MESGNKTKRRTLKAFSINEKILHKVFNVLLEENKKAQEIEIQWKTKIGVEQKEINKVKESLLVSLHVHGQDGEYRKYQTNNLDAIHWPLKISRISVDNQFNYKIETGYNPQNTFEVVFDFSEVDIFDLSVHPTLKTLNHSSFGIIGIDFGWVHGLESQLNEILHDCENRMINFIHSRNIYDFTLWLIFAPILILSISNWTQRYTDLYSNLIIPVQTLLFFWLFIVGTYLFRIFFNCCKRLLPYASLKGDLKKKRDFWSLLRAVLYTGIITLIGTIIKGLFI